MRVGCVERASQASRPTNNASERALRHPVHWRRTSYGTQTDTGNRIVQRLLTTRETCRLQGHRLQGHRLQGHRLHDYLTSAITANLHGRPVPPILAAPSLPDHLNGYAVRHM